MLAWLLPTSDKGGILLPSSPATVYDITPIRRSWPGADFPAFEICSRMAALNMRFCYRSTRLERRTRDKATIRAPLAPMAGSKVLDVTLQPSLTYPPMFMRR